MPDPNAAHEQAIIALGKLAKRQALVTGFSDTFAVIGVVLVLAALAVLPTRRVKATGGPAHWAVALDALSALGCQMLLDVTDRVPCQIFGDFGNDARLDIAMKDSICRFGVSSRIDRQSEKKRADNSRQIDRLRDDTRGGRSSGRRSVANSHSSNNCGFALEAISSRHTVCYHARLASEYGALLPLTAMWNREIGNVTQIEDCLDHATVFAERAERDRAGCQSFAALQGGRPRNELSGLAA